MATSGSTTSINGVNVAALKDTLQAIQRKPPLAAFEFRARNQWLGGAHNRSQVKDFYGAGEEDSTRTRTYVFDCDEPPVLLGEDQGANPVEYLLNALAGCVTTTMVMHAASRGIRIQSVSSELKGDIDIQGFMGLSPDIPRGFRNIQIKMKVKSDAPPEKLRELAEYSPVFNTIAAPTPVQIEIVKAD